MRKKNERAAQAAVDAWNAKYPPGTAVDLKMDSGKVMRTLTRAYAQVAACGDAVIWLEGVRGYYLLDRCKPVARLCIGCGGLVEAGEVPACGH